MLSALRHQCILALCLAALSSNALAQSRLDDVQARGELKIGYRTDSRPFSFVETDGTPSGYSVDLCRQVAAHLTRHFGKTIKVTLVEVTSRSRFDAITNGLVDLECGSTTISLSRLKIVDFSNIIYADSTGVVVPSRNPARGFSEMSGRRIGVIAGSTNARAVAAEAARRKLPVSLIEFVDREKAFDAMANQELDGFATDKLVLRAMTVERGERNYRILQDDLSAEPFAIMMPRGDAELRYHVNAALAQLFRSGEIIELYTKHFAAFGTQPAVWMSAVLTFGAIPE